MMMFTRTIGDAASIYWVADAETGETLGAVRRRRHRGVYPAHTCWTSARLAGGWAGCHRTRQLAAEALR